MSAAGRERPGALMTLFERLEGVLAAGAAALMFALMALACVDVVARYLFRSPVRGGLELTEIMMMLIVFAALPAVTARREHVTADFIPLPAVAWVTRLRQVAIDLLVAFCLACAAQQMFVRAAKTAKAGDVTAQLRMPLSIFVYVVAALAAFAALCLVIRVIAGPPVSAGKESS